MSDSAGQMDLDGDFYKKLLDEFYDGVYFVDRDRQITYWNRGAERITGYSAPEVMGRRCMDNILMHVDGEGSMLCHGSCPLAFTMEDSVPRQAEGYLHHKQGFRVPVSIRVTPLRDRRGQVVGAVEVFSDNSPQAPLLERIAQFERLAYIDPLTELANRRYAEIVLSARHEELKRYGWKFGILFVDIDRFKTVNDTYGHMQGDEVLKMVGRTLVRSVRSFDVVGRWGGEEFIAIIANVDRAEATIFAERMRTLVEHSRLPGDPPLAVTVSIGGTVARDVDSVEELVRRADGLMYRSKQEGRNRVTVDG